MDGGWDIPIPGRGEDQEGEEVWGLQFGIWNQNVFNRYASYMKVGYHNLEFFTIVFALQADKFDGKHERRVGRDDSAESARSYIYRLET